MRELKFRFIDKGDGTVYKPIALKDLLLRVEIPRRVILESENGDFVDTDDFLDLLEKGELIAEQYTELKDKNGKEIYEGDIVDAVDLYSPADVAWHNTKAGFFVFHDADDWYFPISNLLNVEVIGNIHENPELLEGEK